MIETVALFIITNLLAQILKGVVFKKWGTVGVQVSVLAIALVGAIVWSVAVQSEAVMSALMQGVQVFTYAIAFYEVILKNINFGGWKVTTTKDL